MDNDGPSFHQWEWSLKIGCVHPANYTHHIFSEISLNGHRDCLLGFPGGVTNRPPGGGGNACSLYDDGDSSVILKCFALKASPLVPCGLSRRCCHAGYAQMPTQKSIIPRHMWAEYSATITFTPQTITHHTLPAAAKTDRPSP